MILSPQASLRACPQPDCIDEKNCLGNTQEHYVYGIGSFHTEHDGNNHEHRRPGKTSHPERYSSDLPVHQNNLLELKRGETGGIETAESGPTPSKRYSSESLQPTH